MDYAALSVSPGGQGWGWGGVVGQVWGAREWACVKARSQGPELWLRDCRECVCVCMSVCVGLREGRAGLGVQTTQHRKRHRGKKRPARQRGKKKEIKVNKTQARQ